MTIWLKINSLIIAVLFEIKALKLLITKLKYTVFNLCV